MIKENLLEEFTSPTMVTWVENLKLLRSKELFQMENLGATDQLVQKEDTLGEYIKTIKLKKENIKHEDWIFMCLNEAFFYVQIH